ncbi:hypothetical protein A6F68_02471 [Tsuneonella dongtanensis]|uniref:DUF5801 domain-containing protein n=1 Tax=Tsuneonella dongtanensis TaxID=692370 RepID=A0A1B2AFN5_9SPHN|nr:DUF5801 repeats-in-toxin domain-containing protein [Tsuneonella dongtanensis]ANY20967.1 hypothetical protein A6F68_02471 [Tsuneonella dongtanensis]
MDLHNQEPNGFGDQDSAELQDGGAGAGPANRSASRVLVADQSGVVVLPAGTELGDIRIEGRDLVVIGSDGVRYVIPDGAIIVPQLVIDDVAIPPLNLAALLIGNEPQPAAGNPQSSGGNFAGPVGPIQDAFGLGDLLPYTELAFPEPEEREIIPAVDNEPDLVIVTPDQPVGATDATSTVDEAALPARPGEPAGSNASSNGETVTGSIVFNSLDGVGSITFGGTAITAVGQTIALTNGTVTITSIAPGVIGYSYTLGDNLLGATVAETVAVVITDLDGDTATATLTINLLDDAPDARNDTDLVAAGTYGPETGNVITGTGTTSGAAGADVQGADGARVTAISGFGGNDTTFDTAGNLVVTGQYGTLTIKADGSYSYVRTPNTAGGVTDTFTYTLTDGDGDSDTATLVITIADSPASVVSLPTSGAGTVVNEAGLPARGNEAPGTAAPTNVETTAGTITVVAPDGIASVKIGDVTVTGAGQTITVPQGTLTITSYNPATGTIAYSFTLGDNTSGDTTSVSFPITVTDVDGDSDTKTLTITIIDDVPVPANDSAAQTVENAPVTVNVLANDVQGADSVQPGTVTFVPGSLSVNGAAATGTLVNNGNGTFTYTPGPGESGVVTFNYSITDGDGDTRQATVTITLLDDSTPVLGEGANLLVDEDGFGSANVDSDPLQADPSETDGNESLTDSGSVTVDFGGDVPANALAAFVLLDDSAYDSQLLTLDGNPVTFAVEGGVLVGRDSGGGEVIRVSVTGAVPGSSAGEVVYTYSATLVQPVRHADAGSEDVVVLSGVSFQIIDSDGDMLPAAGSFSVSILDDVPSIDIAAGTTNLVVDESFGTGGSVQNEPGGALNNDETAPGAAMGAIGYAKGTLFSVTSVDAGTDGEASRVYALSVTNAASGLVDAVTGEAVTLTLVGGVVEGRTATGNALVFTLSINASTGEVTLNQFRAVEHNDAADHDESGASAAGLDAGTIALGVTLTDGDGDTAVDSVDISGLLKFEDDGPAIDVLTGDDTDVTLRTMDSATIGAASDVASTASGAFAGVFSFTSDAGTDGAATPTLTYALGLGANAAMSGMSSHGAPIILLKLSDGLMVGYTGAVVPTAKTDAQVIFSVEVNASGVVTLTQFQQIDHQLPGDTSAPYNGLSDDVILSNQLITLTASATITDGDGDTATDSETVDLGGNLRFADDGPTAVSPEAASLANNASGSDMGYLSIDGLADNYGADGPGSVRFPGSLETTATGLTSGGAPIKYDVSDDGLTLTAYTGASLATGTVIFTAVINPNTNQYTIDMSGSVDSVTKITLNPTDSSFVGGNDPWAGFDRAGPADILLTPTAPGQTLNTSAILLGVGGGQAVDTGEGVRIDFVNNLGGDPAKSSGANNGYLDAANRDHSFTSHYGTNGASVIITQENGNLAQATNVTANFKAFDDPDGVDNTTVGDGSSDPIDGITITYLGITYADPMTGQQIITPTLSPQNYVISGHTFTVQLLADGSVNVTGVEGDNGNSGAGTEVAVFTASGYNSLVVSNVSPGTSFKIGGFGASVPSTAPVNFSIPVEIIDFDGDTAGGTSISVTLNPAPVVLDLDGDGTEFLSIEAGVTFDYGAGLVSTGWAHSDDGILVRDANASGTVDDATEIVFGHSGMTDLEALAAQYGDILDASDADFGLFGVWQDANSNGVVDAGELRSLAEVGIVSLTLKSDGTSYSAANGDVSIAGSSSYKLTDGTTGSVADASFHTQSKDAQRTAELVTTAALAGALLDATSTTVGSQIVGEIVALEQPVIDEVRFATFNGNVEAMRDNTIGEPSEALELAADANAQATAHFRGETAEAELVADGSDFRSEAPVSDFIAGDGGPSAGAEAGGSLFAAMGTGGVMEGLLAMSAAPGAPAELSGNLQGLVGGAMADFAGEAMLDGLLAHFSPSMEGTAFTLSAFDDMSGLLSQDLGGTNAFAHMAILPEANDDASMLAAAQA